MPDKQFAKPPLTSPLPKQKPYSLLCILILIFASLALGGVMGYFLGISQSKQIVTPSVPPTPPLAISSPTSDSIANWKTYTDSLKGFSFKYPENFSYVTLSNGVVIFLENTTNDYENCKKDLHLERTSEYMNTACWTKVIFIFNGSSILSKSEYDKKIKEIINAGIDQETFKDSQGRVWVTSIVYVEASNFDAYIAVNDNKYYQIGFQGYPGSELVKRAFFNQILSTFKFLDSESPTL